MSEEGRKDTRHRQPRELEGLMVPEAEYRRRARAAARRARHEAERRHQHAASCPRQREVGGPAGPEPTRYGDWERDGIARDF